MLGSSIVISCRGEQHQCSLPLPGERAGGNAAKRGQGGGPRRKAPGAAGADRGPAGFSGGVQEARKQEIGHTGEAHLPVLPGYV